MIRFSSSLKFAALSAAMVLGACTHKQEAVTTPPPPPPVAAPAPAPAPVASGILPGSAEDLRVNVGDTVHFALDQYNVEESDKALLGRQAAWLQKYPSVRVTIEGHADERGTREYNLALGARRANAVKEYLVSQGVSTGRVETVSYGKERPICTTSDEGCWSQNRRGVTIVTGGDAGTAEGDFASCLVWASRPMLPLPMLIIVTNNKFGISTPYDGQHGEKNVADRGKAFGIRTATINGNDIEESWFAIQEAMNYVRNERKPFLLEARVSRLYGHSSATGANLVQGEEDCLTTFEAKLEKAGYLSRKEMEQLREQYNAEMLEMSKQVREEPMPDPSTIYDHTFAGQKGRYW